MHSSSSRGILSSRLFPHPRLLHVIPGTISASGSSDSSSGGSGLGVDDGVCCCVARVAAIGLVTGTIAGIGAAASTASGLGGGAGVSSTVECLPLVQGGMARNSSKVRTRGLQHFHPVNYRTSVRYLVIISPLLEGNPVHDHNSAHDRKRCMQQIFLPFCPS